MIYHLQQACRSQWHGIMINFIFFKEIQVKFVIQSRYPWYYKTENVCELLRSICYPPDKPSMSLFRQHRSSLQRYASLLDFLLLIWRHVKYPVTLGFVSVFRSAHLSKQFCLRLRHRKKLSCILSITQIPQTYAKECLIISNNQLRNGRKSVILSNLLRKMQEISVLSLKKPIRYM